MEIRVLVLWAPEARDDPGFLRTPFVPPHVATALATHTTGVIEAPTKVDHLPPGDEW